MYYYFRIPAEAPASESQFQHLIRFIRQAETDSHPTALPLISQRPFIIQHKPPSRAISALPKATFQRNGFHHVPYVVWASLISGFIYINNIRY